MVVTPVETVDLNAEAIKQAHAYIDRTHSQAPLEIKTAAMNTCAHGVFMGWRACEDHFWQLFKQAVQSSENFGLEGFKG